MSKRWCHVDSTSSGKILKRATSFIENHLPDDKLKPGLQDPPVKFNSRINSFSTPQTDRALQIEENDLFSGAEQELKHLVAAIARYKRKNKIAEVDDTLQIEGKQWLDIFKNALDAIQKHEDGNDENALSRRQKCTQLMNNISAFDGWLNVLPKGDYGAIIGGVFTMLVKGAQRTTELRTKVLTAVSDIPYWIGRASEYRKLYADLKPRQLVHETASMISAVLIALRQILDHLAESNTSRFWKAVIQGSAYKDTLQTYLDAVDRTASRLEKAAEMISKSQLSSLCTLVNNRFEQLSDQISRQSKDLLIPEAITERIATLVFDALLVHLSSEGAEEDVHAKAQKRMTQLYAQHGTLLGARPTGISDAIGAEGQPSIRPPSVSMQSFRGALQTTIDPPDQDLTYCLHASSLLSLDEQDKARWILRDVQFQEWLHKPLTCTLLVNATSDTVERISSTTLLSTKLLESIGKIEAIISLHYFCSLHTNLGKNGEDSAALRMMRSLTLQLLLHQNKSWDLSFLEETEMARYEAGDLGFACTVFQTLLAQLPTPTFMFWIIDGTDSYEYSEWRNPFLDTLERLAAISRMRTNLITKVLLTSHTQSKYLPELLNPRQVLTLPDMVDGDRSGWVD